MKRLQDFTSSRVIRAFLFLLPGPGILNFSFSGWGRVGSSLTSCPVGKMLLSSGGSINVWCFRDGWGRGCGQEEGVYPH